MPKKIYLIRHGETEQNNQKIAQGWMDTILNSSGLEQAELLGKYFSDIHLDEIFTSDLKRAVQTALPISKIKQLSLIPSPQLRERNLGIFEGKTWDVIKTEFKHLYDKFEDIENGPDWKENEGESVNDLTKRINSFFTKLKETHKDKTIAIVTHGGTKRNILHYLNHPKAAGFIHLPNTAISVLDKKQDNIDCPVLNISHPINIHQYLYG